MLSSYKNISNGSYTSSTETVVEAKTVATVAVNSADKHV